MRFAGQRDAAGETEKTTVLGRLVDEQRVKHSPCVAVLPVDSYQLIQVDMGDLPEEERREAVRWQIRDRIDYPPEQAVVDLFEVAPFGSERRPLTYVVSARQQFLREQLAAISQGGLAVEAIDIPEFALRNICELYTEDERGVAILLLLEKVGLLVIVRDGTLYLVRLLSTGMDDLLPHVEGGYEALTEQLDGIVLEIQRSFDFCESTFQLPLVSRLLVAQTRQEIPAVTNYLNEYLATRVEPFSFNGVIDVPEGIGQIELNRHLLTIGGALRRENR